MRFCPECGFEIKKNKCKCGYKYQQGKETKQESGYLFTEPGMREMNDPNKVQPSFEEIVFNMSNGFDGINKMNQRKLTDDEISELLKNKHFTA